MVIVVYNKRSFILMYYKIVSIAMEFKLVESMN